MLQDTHIEGYEGFEDIESYDDTHPESLIVKFSVVSEEMPFLSEQAGHIVRKNFIHVRTIKNLGALDQTWRIHDKVEYDEVSGKWKVLKLDPFHSDIKRFPKQWNAFMRGNTEAIQGTPIEMIFKNDPSRAQFYKDNHIHSVEQLEGLNGTDQTTLGMGVRDDHQRAKKYLQKIREAAPFVSMNNKLEEKDKQIESLTAKISDLSDKLTQLLTEQIEARDAGRPVIKRKRGPNKTKEDLGEQPNA